MEMSKGRAEEGIIFGNLYDKYNSKNPIVRLIMQKFKACLTSLEERVAPKTIHEVGCGEGYWVIQWLKKGILARGSDMSSEVIDLAQSNAISESLPIDCFSLCNIYDLNEKFHQAELVVCCEVLEHLEYPKKALAALQKIVNRYVILSVPREPLWSLMNLARGKYIKRYGNTPGHIQQWTRKQFINLVSDYFDIIEVVSPIPWTMLLCRSRTFENGKI